MSAVDLGGSSSRLRALKKGEVCVAGSFVRSRHDPKAWPKGHNNTWAQVHQPESRPEVELAPQRSAEASAEATSAAERPAADTGREPERREISGPNKENSHPADGRSKGMRGGGTVLTADSPDYGE